jgi:hypothetical protein
VDTHNYHSLYYERYVFLVSQSICVRSWFDRGRKNIGQNKVITRIQNLHFFLVLTARHRTTHISIEENKVPWVIIRSLIDRKAEYVSPFVSVTSVSFFFVRRDKMCQGTRFTHLWDAVYSKKRTNKYKCYMYIFIYTEIIIHLVVVLMRLWTQVIHRSVCV